MKKIYRTITALSFCGLSILGGCEKGLEDETFSVYDENTLTKPEHGEQGVRGVYAALKDNGGFGYYAGHLYWLNEYPGEAVTTEPTSRQGVQIDQLTYDASNATINSVWVSVFKMVSRANEAEALINNIDYISNGSSVEVKGQNLGEVRFLRALAYYDATSLWGDVPLILKPSAEFTKSDENPALTPKAEVEAAMIKDLEFAENNLPVSYPPAAVARATRGAAKSLLVRLYMRRGEFKKAAEKALEVMGKEYDLRTIAEGGIVSLYNVNNRADNEFIFVLKSSSEPGSYAVNSNSFGIGSTPWDLNRGWGSFPITLPFYSTFNAADKRRDLLTGSFKSLYGQMVNVPVEFGGIGGEAPDVVLAKYVYNLKYPHVNNYNYAGFNNVTIIRYADVLMMRAEALNELNGPNQESIDLINQIRNRSELPSILLSNFSTKAALRDHIFEERAKEFFMEGRRRDDLIRWGTSASNGANPLVKFKERVVPTLRNPGTYSDNVNYALYPYPQNEIQSNTSLNSSINVGRVK
jgi:hypothetical protein